MKMKKRKKINKTIYRNLMRNQVKKAKATNQCLKNLIQIKMIAIKMKNKSKNSNKKINKMTVMIINLMKTVKVIN